MKKVLHLKCRIPIFFIYFVKVIYFSNIQFQFTSSFLKCRIPINNLYWSASMYYMNFGSKNSHIVVIERM
jgi:hypothetical protein